MQEEDNIEGKDDTEGGMMQEVDIISGRVDAEGSSL